MNVSAPEPNEKPLERRESSGSNGSDNPLMKLVDAALAPSNDDMVAKPVNESTMQKDGLTPEDNKDTVMAKEDDTEKASPSNQDPSVLKGTVQDLVARQDKKLTFAEYLMQCLNDEANHDVLQWMPCGMQFTITNHRKFTMERMPTLFKIRNMSSFVRKLTRWGFSRVHEKETGNSDIFKHPLFQKDKPELCKKIRCVNRSATTTAPHKPLPPFMGHGGGDMMGNMSESSLRHSMHSQDMHMVSPRRSMGSMGHNSGPYMVSGGRPPYPGRYPPPQQTPVGPPHHPHHHPRVSPEYEKEMIQGNSFHPRHPGPPQVYSPPPIGRSMSAAAEYELEQVLLERQRARGAMYRDQQPGQAPPGQHPQVQHQGQHPQGHPQGQHLQGQHPGQQPQGHPPSQQPPPPPQAPHPQQQGPPRGPPPSISPSLLGNGSERSLGSAATAMTPDPRAGGGRYMESPSNLASATSSVVTAALETLQREGDYEFDMSPREAMLRAVLHKRQQQRAAQQQQQPPPQQQQQQQPPPPRGPVMRGPPATQGYPEAGNPPPPPPPPGRPPAHPPVYYR